MRLEHLITMHIHIKYFIFHHKNINVISMEEIHILKKRKKTQILTVI